MSQSVVSPSLQSPNTMAGVNQFDYRPVPVMAPVTLVFGICSAMALMGVIGVAVSLFGVVVGIICLRKIRRSGGELGGGLLTKVGLYLSVAFLLSGSTLQAYFYQTEVPEGFQRLQFSHDIAKKGFVIDREGRQGIHPDVQALAGQPIFLKGYMYPTNQTEDLTEFILVKDNQQCCFGGQPALTDMIYVKMNRGKTVDYDPRLVSVAGTFRIAEEHAGGPLAPVYELDGAYFSSARTMF